MIRKSLAAIGEYALFLKTVFTIPKALNSNIPEDMLFSAKVFIFAKARVTDMTKSAMKSP